MDKLVKTIDTLNQTIYTLNQSLGILSIYDIGVLSVQVLILIVLIYTAYFIKRQLQIQILKDRITMGWSTDEPITDGHLDNVKYLPDSFIPEKYKKDRDLLGKYMYLDQTYDYFLYVFTSSKKIGDPLGNKWHEVWLKELVTDDIFKDIRKSNASSFDKFEIFLEGIEKSANTSPNSKK